jgi:2-oxoglutarate ferredoxin oxidoreductase subunit alpha
MKEFDHVLVPELNLGQFRTLLRNRFLVDAKGLNKIKGQPFTINEVMRGVRALLDGHADDLEVNVPTDDAGLDVNTESTPGGG